MKQVTILGVLLTLVFKAYSSDSTTTSLNDYQRFLNDPALYSQTVHELNKVVMGNNFSPMVASRNYMYAAVAAYEIISAKKPKQYRSLTGQLNQLSYIPKPDTTTPINYELAALMAYISVGESVTFPEGSMKNYRDSILTVARKKGLPEEVEKASQTFADSISTAIIKWSKKDNYLETRTRPRYEITDDPARWAPTPPAYFEAAEPHWGEIRPLVIDSANAFDVPPPPPFDIKDTASMFYKEMMLIKKAGENLTDEQKHIAIFWDDNPFKVNVKGHFMFPTKKFSPPGHWMSICGIAAAKANVDFATNVYATALTGIVLFDGFIQCFYIKYKYACVRPETVINKFISPQWRPYLQTPAFPEYTCGHSTISASAAEALTKAFGDNFEYTDTSELEFGIKSRSYKSFRAAAEENNWARFYGGIHFHNSCIVSTDIGKQVGQTVAKRLKMKMY